MQTFLPQHSELECLIQVEGGPRQAQVLGNPKLTQCGESVWNQWHIKVKALGGPMQVRDSEGGPGRKQLGHSDTVLPLDKWIKSHESYSSYHEAWLLHTEATLQV